MRVMAMMIFLDSYSKTTSDAIPKLGFDIITTTNTCTRTPEENKYIIIIIASISMSTHRNQKTFKHKQRQTQQQRQQRQQQQQRQQYLMAMHECNSLFHGDQTAMMMIDTCLREVLCMNMTTCTTTTTYVNPPTSVEITVATADTETVTESVTERDIMEKTTTCRRGWHR
mmetsp:Transcript_6586/g.12128  ORF Transcript_6586/g.12128 Transcript_6586/m.12128 type:complete len:170 (+) Transcript_6586:580-1089(+)